MPKASTILSLAALLLCMSTSKAQEQNDASANNKLRLKSDLQLGVVLGGQIANEQFVYKSGPVLQYSINTELSSWIDAGLGMSFQFLESEVILPMFVDVKSRLKQGPRAPFIGLNIGASSGWSTYYRNFSNYEYSGGFYFSPYYAMQFPLTKQSSILFALGFIHQLGHIEYFTEYDERFVESFAMDFLTLRAGLRF